MKSAGNFLKSIYELLDSVIVSAVVVLLVFTFVFKIFVVSGDSMETTLVGGERIVVSDIMFTPERGDIICFYSKTEKEVLVKRVIATEGQVVDIKNGSVYVDDVRLDEEYLDGQYTDYKTVTMPHTVKDDCVFVLGDNRLVSYDSRYSEIGDIHKNDIFGQLVIRLYPNFGKVN